MRRCLILLGLLAACGPISREAAERQCFERAHLASGPHGKIAVGGGTGGATGGVEVAISSDYIMGRDPAEVYDSCVYQKSGQMPSVPLYARPDYKG